MTPYLLNTAWRWQGAAEAIAFRRAARNVRHSQQQVLFRTLRKNALTSYGREYGFASIRTIDEYQRRVPVVRYDDLEPHVERIAAGEPNVLTAERVLLLEPTGGSTAAEKLIPYTAALRRQFQRALAVWVWDVMGRLPAVRRGKAYWSISPGATSPQTTPGGLPIGFARDSEYLGTWQQWLADRLLVMPAEIARIQCAASFRYVTLLHLLACDRLALISVWSPTFLIALLDALPDWLDQICADLHEGRVRPPGLTEAEIPSRLRLSPAPRRAAHLARIFERSGSIADQLARCWPRLKLISCWADAASAMYADRLRTRFPHVGLQPKGLLATEGVVSFPLVGQPGSVPAIRSHFFEFMELDDQRIGRAIDAPTRLADQLEPQRRYRVVLTTGGGLYRYDLGDEIELVGHYGDCPLIRFLGRSGAGSDLVGEKLQQGHVRSVMQRALQRLGIHPDFAMLVPVTTGQPRYRLYLAGSDIPSDAESLDRLGAELDLGLSANPQYRYAVEMQQLGPIDFCRLNLPPGRAWSLYEEACRRRGQKIGDIKPTQLDAWPGWVEVFAPFVPGRKSENAFEHPLLNL